MRPFLFMTDMHGNMYAYEKGFKIAENKQLDLVWGGDLTPKLIAVKFQDYLEYERRDEEDQERIKGEIMPIDMVRGVPISGTHTESLRRIMQLNREVGPEKLEREYRRRGYIIHKLKTGYYNLPLFIDEDALIDRLYTFFSKQGRDLRELTFSEEELLSLESLLETINEIESQYSPESIGRRVKRLIEVLPNSLKSSQLSFNRLSMSTTLKRIAYCGTNILEFQRVWEALTKTIKEQERPGNEGLIEYFSQRIDESYADLETAMVMIRDVHDSTVIEQISHKTPITDLLNKMLDPSLCLDGQKEFVKGYLRERLRKFKQDNPSLKVYTIAGNDEYVDVEEDIRKLDEEGLLVYLNNKVVAIDDDFCIAGYPYVKNSNGRFYAGWEKNEDEIMSELKALSLETKGKRTVYIIHNPPKDTNLDMVQTMEDSRRELICAREHVGSEGVRRFILEEQPYLTLHGHIHESPVLSRSYLDRLGRTVSVNPGGSNDCLQEKNFGALIIDPNNLENMQYVRK